MKGSMMATNPSDYVFVLDDTDVLDDKGWSAFITTKEKFEDEDSTYDYHLSETGLEWLEQTGLEEKEEHTFQLTSEDTEEGLVNALTGLGLEQREW